MMGYYLISDEKVVHSHLGGAATNITLSAIGLPDCKFTVKVESGKIVGANYCEGSISSDEVGGGYRFKQTGKLVPVIGQADIQNYFEPDNIDLTKFKTSAQLKSQALDAALVAVASFAQSVVDQLTRGISQGEMTSWPAKELEAREFLKDSTVDIPMIAIEAELTGEDPAVLAQKIVDKADYFKALVSKMSGLRRKTENALKAADFDSNPKIYDTILASSKTEGELTLVKMLSGQP